MNDLFSITELESNEYVGLSVIGILSIPSLSILQDQDEAKKDFVLEYKRDFANLLSEIYQNYRLKFSETGLNKDLSIELLWITESAKNQTFKANIKIYIIIRAIDIDREKLEESLFFMKNVCISTLQLQKYEFNEINSEDFLTEIKRIKKDEIRAIVKSESLENLQNQFLPECFAFNKIPETVLDLSRIVSVQTAYSDCAVSFQLIPTRYNANEIDILEKMTQLLDTLNRGVQDQGVGNIAFSLAEKHASTYKYYSQNKNSALFFFNILVYGSKSAVENISTRLYGQLNGSAGANDSLRVVQILSEKIDLIDNFYPLPWAVNIELLKTFRSSEIWGQPNYGAFYNLPYIISADEASEFFRLPIGSGSVSAGLEINFAGKNSRSYSNSVINGSDVKVGILKSSSRNDNIGFFLNDLTKHMLVTGTPGSGKTTFLIGMLDRLWKEFKIPFLVIEPAKNEYRALIKSIPDIQVFTPGKNFISPFIFNPFIPPKNVTLETYKASLKTAFSAAVIMSSPLDKIFEEAVNNCYSDFRWLDTYTSEDKGLPFNIVDFIKCFGETFDSIGYTGDAKNIGRAGMVRLNSLINLLDNYNSIPVEDLLSKPTIIELSAIENSDQKALIIALLLLSILSYVNKNHLGDGNLKNVILLEEAHVLLDAAEGNAGAGEADPASIAKSLIKRMLAEIRSYGLGMVIADQSPRKVTADVVGLTNIKLAFRLVENSDKEIIFNSINMTDAQMKRLSKLRPGEAFLFFDKLEDPEEIITEDYRLNNNIEITLSDDDIKGRTTYWDDKKALLKPYPECSLIKTCQFTCDYKVRIMAKEIARSVFRKFFNRETSDFSILREVYLKIERLSKQELNNEPYTRELSACVKMQLLRRIKYYTKIALSDRIIKETLNKI